MSGETGDRPAADGGLGRPAAVMAAGTVLSRLTGFGRVFALAYALGFDRLADTFNLANTTPNIVYELVLGGVLSATLIPVFVGLLTREREDDAWRAISAVVTVTMAGLAALTALAAVAAPLIVRVYTFANPTETADAQHAVATFLLRLFAPQVLCLGVVTLTTALLNARRRFAAPMFSPVLANLAMIAALLAFPRVAGTRELVEVRDETGALLLLGLGTTAGYALQAVAQLVALRGSGLRLRWVWAPRHDAVRTIGRLAGWTFGVVVANQLAAWLVLVLANRHSGDVSAYQAAQMFFQLPYAVVAVSVMTALLPDLSRRWAEGDGPGFARQVGTGVRLLAAILVPAAAGYALLATPIVRVVLQHGALRAESAETTGAVLALLAVGLPGFSVYLLFMRGFQAMQDTRTMFRLYALENGINIALALALHPVLGVQGLALSYSVAYTAAAVVAGRVVRARAGAPLGHRLGTSLARVAAATVVMSAAVAAVAATVEPAPVRAGVGITLGVTVYLVAAKAFGVEALTTLLHIRRRPA